MRFLFFAAQYLPTVGGVERYTYNLCKTLTKLNHSCTIVTSEVKGLPFKELQDNIEIVRLPSSLLLNGRLPIVKKSRETKKLIYEVFKRTYDMVIINTRFYPLSLFGAKECAKRNLKSLIIEHGTGHLSLSNSILDIFVHFYEHITMRRILKFSDNFYGVSKACCDWLEHFKVTAKGVLYNAIDTDGIFTTLDSSSFDIKKLSGINKDDLVVAFSGRFVKEKGIYELLDAFRTINNTYPNVKLIMAGDGPLYDEVETIKSPNVILTGRLSHENNLSLLSAADVFLLPTFYPEGFSTVTLEAAAFGRCIITTLTGGNTELIQNGKSGILLERVLSEDILKALDYVLNDENFRKEAGVLVKETVLNKFTWSKTAETLVQVTQNTNH